MISDYLNCFILLIPIFIWDFSFRKKLPKRYSNVSTWKDVPFVVSIMETLLRSIVLLFSFLLKLQFTTAQSYWGLALYILGILIYFASWLLQIYTPNSKFSQSLLGHMSLSFTPLIWFWGMSLIGVETYFYIPYHTLIFQISVILFILIHNIHSYIGYVNYEKSKLA